MWGSQGVHVLGRGRLLAGLALAAAGLPAAPAGASAPAGLTDTHAPVITAVDVGPLGGLPVALGEGGHVVFEAPSPIDGQSQAALWLDGESVPLVPGAPGASAPEAVTDDGAAAGWVADAAGTWDPFVRRDGVTTILPDAPGDNVAADLDDDGRVLLDRAPAGSAQGYRGSLLFKGQETPMPDVLDGVAPTARMLGANGLVIANAFSPAQRSHAFVWRAGRTPVDLGTLGGQTTEALEVNGAGTVVGRDTTAQGEQRTFTWHRGRMTDVGTLGGAHTRQAIASPAQPDLLNERGDVVGTSELPSGVLHAFLHTRGGRMRDLGTLGGATSHAYGVNDRREVVGMSETASGETHAFLWRDGVMIDLGAYVDGRDSVAAAINDQGQVLGMRFEGSSTQPVVWETRP